MSYGTKYYFRYRDGAGRLCRVDIQKAYYDGAATELVAAETPVEIEWGEQGERDVTQPIMASDARIRFIGNVAGEALKTEVFDDADTAWRLRYTEDNALMWQGYLATDMGSSHPYRAADTIELEARDGLSLLENRPAFLPDQRGEYGRVATVSEHIGTILWGLHSLDITTSMDWHTAPLDPNLGETPYLNALDYLHLDYRAYQEIEGKTPQTAEPTGEDRLDQYAQLQDILERFALVLFQAEGAWHIRQRSQLEADGTVETATMQVGDDTYDFDVADTETDYSADRPYMLSRSEKPSQNAPRLRAVKSVYTYDDLGELVANGGFEETLSDWEHTDDSVSATRKERANTTIGLPQTQEDQYVYFLEFTDPNNPEYLQQSVPAQVRDAGPQADLTWAMDLAATNLLSNQARITLQVGDWYVAKDTVTVQSDADATDDGTLRVSALPGTKGQRIIPEGQRVPIRTSDALREYKGEATLTEPAYAGDTELSVKLPEAVSGGRDLDFWYWTSTETKLSIRQLTQPPRSDAISPFSISIPLRTPGGAVVTGEPFIGFGFTVDSGQQDASRIWVDNVSAQMTVDGDPIEETSYIALDDHVGREITINHRTGDGPTLFHPRAYTHPYAEQKVMADWKEGGYASGESGTGKLLEQMVAESWMRQQRDTLSRWVFEYEERGQRVSPLRVYDIDGTPHTVSYLRYTTSSYGNKGTLELTELKDAGVEGLERAYSMGSSSTGGGGGTGGSTFVGSQTVEGASNWDELSGKPDIVNTFEGRSGDVSLTESDIEEVLSGATITGDVTFDGLLTATNLKADNSFVLPIGTAGTGGSGDGTTTGSGLTVNTVDGAGNVNSQFTASATALNFGSSFDLTATQNAVEIRLKDQDIGITGDSGSLLVFNGTSWQAQGQSTIVAGDALTIEGKSLSQIGFSDLAASKYTDAEAVSAVEAHGNALAININGDAGSVQGANLQEIRSGVTKSDVGLSNVQNVDQTNASNLTSGTIPEGRFPTDFTLDTVSVKDLTVTGTFFKANVETVEISDNLATINKGETSNGVSAGFAGWEVDRGTLTNYFFGFDEGRDRFVVGKGTDRDVVATRVNNMKADGIPFWDDVENRFDTRSDVTLTGGTLNAPAATIGNLAATGSFTLPIGTAGTGGSGDGTSTGSGLTVNEVDANGNITSQLTASATALNIRGGATLTADQNAVTIDIDGAGINISGTTGDVAYHNGTSWQALDQTNLVAGDSQQLEGQSLSAVRSGVTKSDVGLSNVPNVDTTDASNITSGTLSDARINGSGAYSMGTLELANEEYNDYGQPTGGRLVYDASTGVGIYYGSSGSGVSKGQATILDTNNTSTGPNLSLTGGASDSSVPSLSIVDSPSFTDLTLGGNLTVGGTLSGTGGTDRLDIYQNTGADDSYTWMEMWGDAASRAGEFTIAGTYIAFRAGSTASASGNPLVWIRDKDQPLEIKSGTSSEVMRLGGNEIDVDTGKLYLQHDNTGDTVINKNGGQVVIGAGTANRLLDVGGRGGVADSNTTIVGEHSVAAVFDRTSHYGYFAGFRSDGQRGFYVGYGNGSDQVWLYADNASKWVVKSGEFVLNDNPLYLRTPGDRNHFVKYHSTHDGPRLAGYSGGSLYTTQDNQTQLWWDKEGVSANGLRVHGRRPAERYANGENSPAIEIDTSNGRMIQMDGSTSVYRINVQDGTGRVHHRWNAYESGSSTYYDVGGEGATWFEMGGGYYDFNCAGSGTAGNGVNWTRTLHIDLSGIDVQGHVKADTIILPVK